MPNPLTESDPPLVDVKVTNPVTYFKKVWAKIIGNEGVDLSLHIKPLTAIIISIVIATIGFGFGRFIIPFDLPFLKYVDQLEPTSTPKSTEEPSWRETAFNGNLQFSQNTKRYYLVTTSSEAITLDVPENIDLENLIGKRVLAAGLYNKNEKILKIYDAKNMEVLPKSPIPIPTVTPIPSPTPTIPVESSTPNQALE